MGGMRVGHLLLRGVRPFGRGSGAIMARQEVRMHVSDVVPDSIYVHIAAWHRRCA
jgi:hypothetical protein